MAEKLTILEVDDVPGNLGHVLEVSGFPVRSHSLHALRRIKAALEFQATMTPLLEKLDRHDDELVVAVIHRNQGKITDRQQDRLDAVNEVIVAYNGTRGNV